MRAARVHRHGDVPRVEEVPDPQPAAGQALVDVLAAPLNPVDLSIAGGRFHSGPPPLPHIPGREGVGVVVEGERLAPGARVYFDSGAALAERAAVDEDAAIVLPDGVEPALAASLGVAGLAGWLPLAHHAPLDGGERVLVLGASGAVGQVAVQAARILGAGRVLAAARSEEGLARARELGADATVSLSGGAGALDERLREAAGGELDVVVDPLWGAAAVAAARALAPGGRLVNLGQSAGAEAVLPSSLVRGRGLRILGHSNALVGRAARREAYLALLGHAAAGTLRVELETLPLAAVGETWRRQGGSPHRKLVLVP